MLTHVAANQMAADRTGNQYEVHDSISVTSEGVSGHDAGTDLGSIDYLFRDPFHSALNAVNQAVAIPTQSTPGPNGGRIPSYLTHAGVILKADGQELVQGSNAGAAGWEVAGARGPALGVLEPFRTLVYRARIALNRIGGGGG